MSLQLAAARRRRGRVERGVRARRCRRRSSRRASRGLVSGALTPGDLLRLPQALTIRERPVERDAAMMAQLVAARRGGRRGGAGAARRDARRAKASTCAPISTRAGALLGGLIERIAAAADAGRAGAARRGCASACGS